MAGQTIQWPKENTQQDNTMVDKTIQETTDWAASVNLCPPEG